MVLQHLLGGKNAGSPMRRSRKIRRRATRGQIWALRPRCEVMEDRTLLATMLWATDASGDWDVASNWVNAANPSDQHVPTSSDDAQVNFSGITVTHSTSASDTVNSLTSQASFNLSGGSLSVVTTSVISGSFAMSGGTLTGSGNLTVTGPTTWTGGTMSGSGVTDAQGGLTIGSTESGSYTENLSGRTLDNDATATLSSPSPDSPNGLDFYNGATLINEPGASFSVTTDTSIVGSSGNTFINEGTFAKTGGTNSPVSVTFNQSGTGTTLAESGTLNLNGGGTISGTAATAMSVSPGATLEFTSGTFTIASATAISDSGALAFWTTVNANAGLNVTGSGALNIASGTLTLNANASFPALNLSNGTLTGSGNLTVTGPTTWTGGTMSGSGVTDAQGGLTIGGTGTGTYNENLSGRTLENDATATLSSSSPDSPNGLDFYKGATVINEPGASFSVTTDTSIANGNGVNTFVNEGTFAKTGGTSSPVSVTFNQSGGGTTLAESGTLQFNGGETFAGRVEATGGGSLKMAIAPTNLTAGTLTGATWSVGANSAIFIDGDITTNAANIILDGASSQIIDQNGNDALANLADISAAGGFTIQNGRNFTAPLGLSNAGNITIGTGSTLTGNVYQVGGQTNVLGTLNGVRTSPPPPPRPGFRAGVRWRQGLRHRSRPAEPEAQQHRHHRILGQETTSRPRYRPREGGRLDARPDRLRGRV